MRNALFAGGRLSEFFQQREHELKSEVASYDARALLATAPTALEKYFVDKYSIEPLQLHEDRIETATDEAEVDVRHDPRRMAFHDRFARGTVPGTKVTLIIPFDGDGELFEYAASTYSSTFPHGEVHGQELWLVHLGADPTQGAVKAYFDRERDLLRQYVNWSRNDVAGFDGRLAGIVTTLIGTRRQMLLSAAGVAASLGFPMRKRADSPSTYAAPEVRRKPRIAPPPSGRGAFTPEPTLAMEEYEHILTVLRSMTLVLERSPSAFATMDEEAIRQHFLVQLNGQYEGQATGETFNAEGKTDILIRSGDRNVFIAECKFWKGPEQFAKAIDQLLGYLTWRDTKAAIVLFNTNKNLSAVLSKIPEVVNAHPSYRQQVEHKQEGAFRFILVRPDDPGRELLLTVLVFDVPRT